MNMRFNIKKIVSSPPNQCRLCRHLVNARANFRILRTSKHRLYGEITMTCSLKYQNNNTRVNVVHPNTFTSSLYTCTYIALWQPYEI